MGPYLSFLVKEAWDIVFLESKGSHLGADLAILAQGSRWEVMFELARIGLSVFRKPL